MLSKFSHAKYGFLSTMVFLLTIFLMAPAEAQKAEVATNVRMQKIVQTAVQKLGCQVMILGSWVSGSKYGDPLLGGKSDHDMRLVLSKATNPAVALEEWKNAKNAVEQLVRKEFGDKADDVLKTCNLYPPKQLMDGVEDSADALDRFKKLGHVPGLSNTGKVTKVTEEMAEGLYGKGSQTWTQAYENSSGKLIYTSPVKTKEGKIVNKVFTGAADITHLEEGIGRYTTGGMGNTSKQWISHAEDAIKSGSGDKVVKYLERLERDMAKARELAGMEISGKWREEMHSLIKQLKADPKSISLMDDEVRKMLGRAEFTSSILSKMDNKSIGQKLVLSNLIKAADDGHEFASTIKEVAQSVPLDKVLDLVAAAVATYEVSSGAGEEDPTKVLLGLADFGASLPVSLVTRLTNEILESTKDKGYDLVANSQEAFDLLDGFYTATGRENAEGTQYSINQLVEKYREGDEEKLKSFVYGLCTKASDRQAGTATGATDTKVADSMHAKCYPIILRAWRSKRMLLMHKVDALRNSYIGKGIQLSYSPVPAKVEESTGNAEITVQINTLTGKLENELSNIRDILTTLYGTGNYFVKVEDKWSPKGREGANDNQRKHTFKNGGVYPITVKRTISIGGNGIPAGSYLNKELEMFAGVDIEVGGFGVAILPPTLSGLTASFTANVFSLPSAVKKLGYRWSFGDLNSVQDQESPYPVEVFRDGLAGNIVMTRTHTYKSNKVYSVNLALYDLTKGPYVEWVTRPIATARVPVDLNLKLNEGKCEIRILMSCRDPKDTEMPPDWRAPGIVTDVECSLGGYGTFDFSKSWRDGGDSFDDFKYAIQGSGVINIATGIMNFNLNWSRSRAYIGNTTEHKYDVTQNDDGVMEITGTLKVLNSGNLNFTQTNSSGMYDSIITFAEAGKEPIVYQCSGSISKDSNLRIARPE